MRLHCFSHVQMCEKNDHKLFVLISFYSWHNQSGRGSQLKCSFLGFPSMITIHYLGILFAFSRLLFGEKGSVQRNGHFLRRLYNDKSVAIMKICSGRGQTRKYASE